MADLMSPDFALPPDAAVDLLSTAMAAGEPLGAVGVHCCAPADWASLLAAGPRVLSMPATRELASIGGYLQRFLEDGGWIAWGAVAVDGPIGVTGGRAWHQLSKLWCEFVRSGVDPVLIRRQSMITPHCGLGVHSVSVAERVYQMVRDIARRVRDQSTAARFVLGAWSAFLHSCPMSERSERNINTGAAERISELRAQVAYHNRRYHELDAPEISDGDFDAARPRAAAARGGESRPGRRRVAGRAPSAARRACCSRPVVHAVPMTSLDNAMSADELHAWGNRVRRSLGDAAGQVRVRVEDRWAGDEPAVRKRPVRPGRDAGRRPRRRGRHRQRRHDRRDPEAVEGTHGARGARGRRGPRRDLHDDRRIRSAQRGGRRGGWAALRQPAQLGGRQPSPEGPADHRQARVGVLGVPAR